MSLDDNIMYPNPSCIGGELGVNHVKKCFKDILKEGEVLKNGAFIINYKTFKELVGEKLL